MSLCGRNMFRLLCGGEYKFLLRSAWIVLIMTTLINVIAVVAYCHLGPQTLDSDSGTRLSFILFIALQFQYFFADLLSCFIVLELYPDTSGSPRRAIRLNYTARDHPTSSYGQSSHTSSMTYCDGLRHALPNNAAPSLPYRNPHRPFHLTEGQEVPNIRTTENAAGSNMSDRNFILTDEQLSQSNNSTDSSLDQVVPEIVITEPEDVVPTYENVQVQQSAKPSRFPRRAKNESFSRAISNGDYLNKASTGSFYPRSQMNKVYKDKEISLHQKEVLSRRTVKPVSVRFEGDNRVAYEYHAAERQTGKRAVQQSQTETPLTVKPVSFRCGNYINGDDKQTLEMSMHQTKIHSRTNNINRPTKPVPLRSKSCYVNRCDTNQCNASLMYKRQGNTDSKRTNSFPSSRMEKSTGPDALKQLRSEVCTITRNSDTSSVKPQPFISQYKRYTVDKLPPSTTRETELLFDAIVGCENVFQKASKLQREREDLNNDDSLRNVLVLI